MRSLSSLLRDTDRRDELSQALEAILNTGMILALRDDGGRFVQMSEVFGRILGFEADVRGRERIGSVRYFDAEGRELSLREHPSHIARTTGTPQRNLVLGVRSDQRDAWMLISYVPMERGPEGYSVLSLGADITDIWHRLTAAEARATIAEAMLKLAAGLAGARLSADEAAERLQAVTARLLCDSNVSIVERAGAELLVTPVQRAYGDAAALRMRCSPETAARWATGQTHVNLDVQETDIYGDRVVATLEQPPRSLLLVPAPPADGVAHRFALVATALRPQAYSEDQVQSLEHLARLLGPALVATEAESAAAA